MSGLRERFVQKRGIKEETRRKVAEKIIKENVEENKKGGKF